MKAITIVLLLMLMAFSSVQATVLTFGHAGADHLSLKGAISAASTGDTLLCVASYTDSMTVGATPSTMANLTIDFGGYTGTYNLTSSSDHVVDADYVNDFVLRNGTMIMNNCSGVELRGSGYMLVSGITQKLRGVISNDPLSSARPDTDSIRIEESTFQYEDLNGNQVNYPGHDRYGLQIAYDIPVRLINSTFRGGRAWLHYNMSTGAQSGEVEIDGCTFENGYYQEVSIKYGGNITVTDCTFQTDSVMSYAGLQIDTPSGIAQNITVSGNTFNDVKLYVGISGDVAQGGTEGASAVISGNTFTGENIISQCIVRTNYAQVYSNTFSGAGGNNFGGTDGSPHMLILGVDGAEDTYDNTAAENISVYDNTFAPIGAFADTASTVLAIIVKTGSSLIYENTFDFRGSTLGDYTTRAKGLSLRSADSLYIVNNDFYFNNEIWGPIDLSSQTDDEPCVGVVFANNRIFGTHGSAISTYNIGGTYNDNQFSGADISANYFEDNLNYIITNNGVTPVSTVNAADSTDWFDVLNFTDESMLGWMQLWGGNATYGALTSVMATDQGFYPIGVQSSVDLSTQVDPVVGYSSNTSSPFRSAPTTLRFLRTNGMDVSGGPIELLYSTDQSGWFFGVHDTATVSNQTFEQVSGDTLRLLGGVK